MERIAPAPALVAVLHCAGVPLEDLCHQFMRCPTLRQRRSSRTSLLLPQCLCRQLSVSEYVGPSAGSSIDHGSACHGHCARGLFSRLAVEAEECPSGQALAGRGELGSASTHEEVLRRERHDL